MRAISLFSGIEALSVAARGLDWKVVAYAEIEPFPCALLDYYYHCGRPLRVPEPLEAGTAKEAKQRRAVVRALDRIAWTGGGDAKNWGDVSQLHGEELPDADWIVAGPPCFTAGHLVLTVTGYMPIERIRVGDRVMTHKGRLKPVAAAGQKQAGVGKLVGVGLTQGMYCTADHPWMSFERIIYNNKLGAARTVHFAGPTWTRAADMPGKQWTALTEYEEIEVVPPSGNFTLEETMYLAGVYLGRGWVRSFNGHGKKEVRFVLEDKKYQKFLTHITNSGRFTVTKQRNEYTVAIRDTELACWMSKNFGVSAENKTIPAWVYGNAQRIMLLKGYIDTDRKNDKLKKTISTVSQCLAFGICDLFNTCEYSAAVYIVRDIIRGRNVVRNNYFEVIAIDLTTSKKTSIVDKYLLRNVNSFTESGIQTVYNIAVEDDNSYIVQGAVVHNCQDYSIAGKRAGIEGDRGNMTLQLLRIYNEYDTSHPRNKANLLFENVPGLLSDRGNAFGLFLAQLAWEDTALEPPGGRWTNAGYVSGPKRSIAWRVLDAQYFGLAQKRERVFVVASSGNVDPAEILFEYDSVCGNHAARRRTSEELAGVLDAGLARSRGAGTNPGALTVSQRAYDGGNTSGERTVSTALNAHGSRIDFDTETFVVRSVEDDSADSADPMEPRGCRLVTQAVTCSFGGGGPDDNKAQAGFYVVVQEDGNVSPDTDSPEQHFVVGSTAPPVTTHPYNDNISRESGLIVTAFNGAQDPAVYDAVSGPCGRNQGQETCIAFTERSRNGGRNLEMQDNLAYALQNPASGGGTHSRRIATRSAVRRLTPRECERLQGFPDDYTLIPYARRAPKTIDDERIDYLLRGGRATYDECLRAVKDSPRYKTIGNSKAVNVIRWILLRIERFHFQQQRSCPVWCPCSADNMPIRHGSEICFNIQMRYAAEYRSETPVKKKYKVSVM